MYNVYSSLWETQGRAMEHHQPYEITQCYLSHKGKRALP